MKTTLLTLAIATLASIPVFGQSEIIAYWAQNDNDLPSGGFGFVPASFPQTADLGNGTLTLGNFITTTGGLDGAYTTIQSFGGDTLNAQPSFVAGGSLSPQGGPSNGNNGMFIDLNVSLTGFEDIVVSWAQRGTASGFTSRAFSYSTNGVDFTTFATDTGALSATWVLESYDLSTIVALNDAASATFRITLNGASGATGNNRFDNLTVAGTPIPEPSAAASILALIGVLALRRRA